MSYVCVVGGINVDICGRSEKKLVPADSNPGRVTVSPGGVGRNIAHNLTLLGVPVKMLTALGTDANAELARADCRRIGIDLSEAKTVPGGVTSSYLYVEGPEKELAVGICDAAIAEEVTPAYIREKQSVLDGAAAVVMDGNIPEETLACIGDHARCPVFADPVSVTKGRKLLGVLPALYAVKPNVKEAEMLAGRAITDEAELREAAARILAKGVKNVYISRGAEGLYAAGQGWELSLPNPPDLCTVGTNGCGDTMTAALAAAYIMGLGPEETARFALGAAALALESEETVNPGLTREAALRKAGLIS